MQSAMSDDDAAYSALLAQLLSDSAPARNARVHSWIEHQYDFVFAEHDNPFRSSRPPSPSPSSSLGARRTHSIDRPDSPLLPRISSDRPCSPYDDFEEQERVRALRFIVQEMAHWKAHVPPSSDKPLPAPPPSPASSVTQSTSSRPVRSRSSSTRISRLPSFTSTLSSDQSHPQDLPPPLPVSVIVHGEFRHDLVLSRDLPLVDGYLHKRDDSCHLEQDAHFLSPLSDDLDSALHPSPTCTTFSFAHSRDTSFTTSPASPVSAVFSPCPPENVALPSSPLEDHPFYDSAPSYNSGVLSTTSLASLSTSPLKSTVSLASPSFPEFSSPALPEHLSAPNPTQSRWSIATTVSVAPSNLAPKPTGLLSPRSPSQEKKDKTPKTPKKRTRFISLISRLSPARNDPSLSTTSTTDDPEYDSPDESDSDDKDKKPRKSLSKKSSLASLRASFSISRASFNSQRPPLSSPTEEVPPLPTSPTVSSPLADIIVPVEPAPPRPSFSRIPSRATLGNSTLPPIPQSASTITSFYASSSRVSVSSASAESRLSPNPNPSRASLLPAPSKRTSLASAAGIEPMTALNPVPSTQATIRSKSIFRLTPKPKSLKTPAVQATKPSTSSRLPSPPSSATVRSRIPQAPAKFIPPAKLANIIATQSSLAISAATSPSKLPTPPTRVPPKVPRITTSVKQPVDNHALSTKLPMPASVKGNRVTTVKGFWKRQ